jgi:hypothetical protein
MHTNVDQRQYKFKRATLQVKVLLDYAAPVFVFYGELTLFGSIFEGWPLATSHERGDTSGAQWSSTIK